jgi:hypothetical protein
MVDEGPTVVKRMGRSRRFNTTSFINEMISELVRDLKRTGKFPAKRGDRSHLDNAKRHTSESSGEGIDRSKFVGLLHPPYSLDLVTSDFHRFGTLKARLIKWYGTTKEELFRNVTEIRNSISEAE